MVIAEAGPYALNVCEAVQWFLKQLFGGVTSKKTLKACNEEIGHVDTEGGSVGVEGDGVQVRASGVEDGPRTDRREGHQDAERGEGRAESPFSGAGAGTIERPSNVLALHGRGRQRALIGRPSTPSQLQIRKTISTTFLNVSSSRPHNRSFS